MTFSDLTIISATATKFYTCSFNSLVLSVLFKQFVRSNMRIYALKDGVNKIYFCILCLNI